VIYDEKQKEHLKKDISGLITSLEIMLNGNKFFTDKFSGADASVLGLVKVFKWIKLDAGTFDNWFEETMKDEKIAEMFAPEDEKGVREI